MEILIKIENNHSGYTDSEILKQIAHHMEVMMKLLNGDNVEKKGNPVKNVKLLEVKITSTKENKEERLTLQDLYEIEKANNKLFPDFNSWIINKKKDFLTKDFKPTKI